MADPILVYVAGPFSAPTREGVEANIAAAVQLGLEVAKLGAMPVIPHANTAHPDFEKVQPYQFWIAGTMALLRACGVCIMREGWEASSGAKGERDEMIRLGRPVFYSTDELRHWLRAVELLSGCVRNENQDHAFGDAEIYWERGSEEIGYGYHGREGCSVSLHCDEHAEWHGAFAAPLLRLGKVGKIERNGAGGRYDDGEDINW